MEELEEELTKKDYLILKVILNVGFFISCCISYYVIEKYGIIEKYYGIDINNKDYTILFLINYIIFLLWYSHILFSNSCYHSSTY